MYHPFSYLILKVINNLQIIKKFSISSWRNLVCIVIQPALPKNIRHMSPQHTFQSFYRFVVKFSHLCHRFLLLHSSVPQSSEGVLTGSCSLLLGHTGLECLRQESTGVQAEEECVGKWLHANAEYNLIFCHITGVEQKEAIYWRGKRHRGSNMMTSKTQVATMKCMK